MPWESFTPRQSKYHKDRNSFHPARSRAGQLDMATSHAEGGQRATAEMIHGKEDHVDDSVGSPTLEVPGATIKIKLLLLVMAPFKTRRHYNLLSLLSTGPHTGK